MYFLAVNKVKQNVEPAKIGAVIPPHVQWLKECVAEGTVVQAGKWGDSGGISIVRADSLTDAMEILKNDPLVQSGLITFETAELHPLVEMRQER